MSKIPENLYEALDYLINKNKDKEAINYLNNISEENFVCEQHHNIGQYLRNNWGLWSGETEISKLFYALGIYHADDMSNIILTSFYRKFHNIDIKLEEQIDNHIKYWKKVDPKVNEGFYNKKDNVKIKNNIFKTLYTKIFKK